MRGHPLLQPLHHRGHHVVLPPLLGRSDVTDPAGQRTDRSGRLDPPDRFHLTHDTGVVHDTITAPWTTPRNSRQPFTKPWARSSRSRSLSSSGMWSRSRSSSIRRNWSLTSVVSPLGGCGQRLAHSTASACEETWMTQYPAMNSLASVKGPSTTVASPSRKITSAPSEVGASPSPASRTPALAISSLYAPIASYTSGVG